MHFWIDKRSTQCGFGRSRVAASLHTGGSGLSFGHPPRRSGGHKLSSPCTTNSTLPHSGNTSTQVHRQQHHHHSQQQTPAIQSHGHVATTSNNTHTRAVNYTSGGSSSIATNNNNNSNNTSNHATNRNFVRSNTAMVHHHHNNNRQHGAGSHHPHQQQQQHSANFGLPNSNNNNHVNLAGTTQNLVSPTGNNLNTSLNNSSTPAATLQHAQRYRHPQFGNMSVRTYQPNVQQQPPLNPTSTLIQIQQQQPIQTQLQQSITSNITTTTSNVDTVQLNSVTATSLSASSTTNQLQQSLDASSNTLNEHGINQSPNQTANLTVDLYQQQMSPRIINTFSRNLTVANMSPSICNYNNASSNLHTTYTNSTLTSTANHQQYHHHQQQSHTRHRRNTRSIESTDLQFLPLHLKCGIFASLVLAIAFIVGIKVYFDNHGTKFEVGLFWLLTATFVFAFCFVSICKVPRVLFASTTSSRSNSRDQTRDRCSMDGAGGRGSMVNSMDDAVMTGVHEFQQEQIQSININTQAGPPPYHIAILLPETKAKEDISTLEESPPPSYDKILI